MFETTVWLAPDLPTGTVTTMETAHTPFTADERAAFDKADALVNLDATAAVKTARDAGTNVIMALFVRYPMLLDKGLRHIRKYEQLELIAKKFGDRRQVRKQLLGRKRMSIAALETLALSSDAPDTHPEQLVGALLRANYPFSRLYEKDSELFYLLQSNVTPESRVAIYASLEPDQLLGMYQRVVAYMVKYPKALTGQGQTLTAVWNTRATLSSVGTYITVHHYLLETDGFLAAADALTRTGCPVAWVPPFGDEATRLGRLSVWLQARADAQVTTNVAQLASLLVNLKLVSDDNPFGPAHPAYGSVVAAGGEVWDMLYGVTPPVGRPLEHLDDNTLRDFARGRLLDPAFGFRNVDVALDELIAREPSVLFRDSDDIYRLAELSDRHTADDLWPFVYSYRCVEIPAYAYWKVTAETYLQPGYEQVIATSLQTGIDDHLYSVEQLASEINGAAFRALLSQATTAQVTVSLLNLYTKDLDASQVDDLFRLLGTWDSQVDALRVVVGLGAGAAQ